MSNINFLMFLETRMKKSMQAYLSSLPAIREWQRVGRGLGLTQEDVEAIGGTATDGAKSSAKTKAANPRQLKEQAQQMLAKWMEIGGEDVTTDKLIDVLRKLKLNETAGTCS
jgi:hypothetical protein